jgi:hypothetical protein
MNPVEVSVHVPFPRELVYEFLAISANHESFNRHMLSDWSFTGPPRGVGSKTHAIATLGGRRDAVDIEVVEDIPPTRIAERNVGARGKRVGTGTYSLATTETGTRVTFEYAWQRIPVSERLAAAVVRRVMHRMLETSMRELAATLDATFAQVKKPSS